MHHFDGRNTHLLLDAIEEFLIIIFAVEIS
jgi:hypothetical protein